MRSAYASTRSTSVVSGAGSGASGARSPSMMATPVAATAHMMIKGATHGFMTSLPGVSVRWTRYRDAGVRSAAELTVTEGVGVSWRRGS